MDVSGSAIYECNIKCTCDNECWNRVVQLGSRVKLAIFKTKNGCGWGVKAKQKIVKGTFIMEYLGEVNFSFFLFHFGIRGIWYLSEFLLVIHIFSAHKT